MDKEAIRWSVGVPWQPWRLGRRVTAWEWVLHQRACPSEVAGLVSAGKGSAELRLNAFLDTKCL